MKKCDTCGLKYRTESKRPRLVCDSCFNLQLKETWREVDMYPGSYKPEKQLKEMHLYNYGKNFINFIAKKKQGR